MASELQGIVEIGEAAGAIWQLLSQSQGMTQAQVIKEIDLPRDLVLKAIGWLAREDKLVFSGGRTVRLSLRQASGSEEES